MPVSTRRSKEDPMKITTVSLSLLLCGLGLGCSSSTPVMPMIGAQLDRIGRAGVNTALTDPFDQESGMTEDMTKHPYHRDTEMSNWVITWAPRIAKSLGVLDALDRNCGNQFAAGPQPVAG